MQNGNEHFESYKDAMAFAKNNPGKVITRNPYGVGFITKEKSQMKTVINQQMAFPTTKTRGENDIATGADETKKLFEFLINNPRKAVALLAIFYPFDCDLVDRYGDVLDVFVLNASHESLPWSEALIEKYKDKWDWGVYWGCSDWRNDDCNGLSGNKSLPWSESLIDKFLHKWKWQILSGNKFLPWSEAFIEKYIRYDGNETRREHDYSMYLD